MLDHNKHYDNGDKVAAIKLLDSSLVVVIDEFGRTHSLKPVECDVFVSIASENRDEVWRAPKAVNYILNIVNCLIVFSYTC
jgi:hypothetical protein